tara:strand:+ start:308 stop:481 length:174 start_codon:yes stop_codon:yes gene_type:complete
MQKPHGNTGNTHAIKNVKKESMLTLRCTSKDKARWVKLAKGQKLAQFVTETLNNVGK